MQMFITPVGGGSGKPRQEPAPVDNPSPPVHNPAKDVVVVSDPTVSVRRAPEGQDDGPDEKTHNDSKAAAPGICICVTAVYRYAFMNTRI
jgi:hypothetical protein